MINWEPDIETFKIFPAVEISRSGVPFAFHEGTPEMRQKIANCMVTPAPRSDTTAQTLNDYMVRKSSTVALLVIRNDSILFENYYRGYDSTTISGLFSVSKSVTSLLAGIAVDEGHITSIHDPVTKYIPELAGKDPRWQRLTIEHLLNMRSGFKFNEDNHWPLSKAANLYYGTNYLRQMKHMRFEREPGEHRNYQSATTAMLGVVVQRATGRNLAEYLQEKVWNPLGMENRATWSLDDRRHRLARADCGLNATVRDLAKIGRLYLNGGNWNGVQIVDSTWVSRSTIPNTANTGYQYQWYSAGIGVKNPSSANGYFPDAESAEKFALENVTKYGSRYWSVWKSERGRGWGVSIKLDQFYALGIYHQVLYIDPAKNLIMVRLGEGSDGGYPGFFHRLAKIL
jgi:CubicO group peptidase (beta-lactamase class C family)